MKKKRRVMTMQLALRKAEAELRLEGCLVPVWGKNIFKKVQNESISLDAARKEIKNYIAAHLVTK